MKESYRIIKSNERRARSLGRQKLNIKSQIVDAMINVRSHDMTWTRDKGFVRLLLEGMKCGPMVSSVVLSQIRKRFNKYYYESPLKSNK